MSTCRIVGSLSHRNRNCSRPAIAASIFTRANSARRCASFIRSALTRLSPAPLNWPFLAHLGIKTQRQRSDKAILRITPCLLALCSLVTLAAQDMLSSGQLYRRCVAWYPKLQATFSDTIACVRACVRRGSWSHAYLSTSHVTLRW